MPSPASLGDMPLTGGDAVSHGSCWLERGYNSWWLVMEWSSDGWRNVCFSLSMMMIVLVWSYAALPCPFEFVSAIASSSLPGVVMRCPDAVCLCVVG
jgi:hypothetical protein